MGKKLDKKAEPAAGKTSKGMKVDKAVKKFRKLEGKPVSYTHLTLPTT